MKKGIKVQFKVLVLVLILTSGCAQSSGLPNTSLPRSVVLASVTTIAGGTNLSQTSIISSTQQFSLTPSASSTKPSSPTPSIVELILKDCWMRGDPPELKSRISPDGHWLAAGCYNLEGILAFEKPYFEIVKLVGKQTWKYSFEELTGKSPCGPYPGKQYPDGCYFQVNWIIDHWSSDSRYVFITIDLVLGRYTFTQFKFGLYRIDNLTGNVSAWLPYTGIPYFFSFSPDGNFLAYATYIDGFRLHLNAIETGTTTEVPLPGLVDSLTKIVWSPESLTVAVSALYGKWWEKKGSSSLFVVSVNDLRLETLISHDPRIIYPDSWDSENLLNLIVSLDEVFQYDLSSNTLIRKTTP